MFGALQSATGAAFTATYACRTTANWADFLGRVEDWIGPAAERVYGKRRDEALLPCVHEA